MASQHSFDREGRIDLLTIIFLVALGSLRIALTYPVFWQTWDEPFHIAAGMEWLAKETYTYEPFHPPLPRIMAALGLFLTGARGTGEINNWRQVWDEGFAILQSGGNYEQNLTIARLGILPFFVMSNVGVTLWAKRLGGWTTAVIAIALFTTLPPILAHSGLATLDIACAATVVTAWWSLSIWLEDPNYTRSLLLGSLTGVAILSKLSALAFFVVPATFLILCLTIDKIFIQKTLEFRSKPFVNWIFYHITIFLTVLITIWAGYRFSVSPYPLAEIVQGIKDFNSRSQMGHLSYLLGHYSFGSRWYFFPTLLLFKTPIPFLALTIVGSISIGVKLINHRSLRMGILLFSAICVLSVGMMSGVNNGLRQILAIYPILSIIASLGFINLMRRLSRLSKNLAHGSCVFLLGWQLTTSVLIHPDYLAYFNELAAGKPEAIAIDSDLDWGQDLKRLSQVLESQSIETLYLKYNGSLGLDLQQFEFPQTQELIPYQKVSGWVAISIYYLVFGIGYPYDHYDWLKDYEPELKVGSSIYLYNIPR